jgi:hypothetical protein
MVDFEPTGLPNPFFGPLATAPAVLLFLNPGLRPYDVERADDVEAHDYFARQRTGRAPLPSKEEYEATHQWLTARLQQFGCAPDMVRDKLAVLNLCPYRTKTFDTKHMLAALPSCRVCLDWAQSVLFPAAEQRSRVVVCLRSARYWGLDTGENGEAHGHLFVPRVTRSGVMIDGQLREGAIGAVRGALGL